MSKRPIRTAYLDAVTKARSDLVLGRATLEQRLREQMERELNNLQARLDVAVRFAYEQGHSKGEITRAMGAKYYGIVNDSLERTDGISEAVGIDPLDSVYEFDVESGVLSVNYVDHGPNHITGSAEFQFKILDDGSKWLFSKTPLWSEDYRTKNEVVASLDNRQDGYYYEEALQWLTSSNEL